VVGRDHAEGLRGELRPELRADLPAFLELGQDLRVVIWVRDRGDTRRVARGCAEQRRATDVDHVDGFVDANERPPDLRAERPHVDDDEIDGLDALALQLLELLRLVASRQDARVHRVVERLDLSAEHRGHARHLGDGSNLDAVLGEVLASSVGREEVDALRLEAASEDRDSVPCRDREQRSHPHPPRRAGPFRWRRAGKGGARTACDSPRTELKLRGRPVRGLTEYSPARGILQPR